MHLRLAIFGKVQIVFPHISIDSTPGGNLQVGTKGTVVPALGRIGSCFGASAPVIEIMSNSSASSLKLSGASANSRRLLPSCMAPWEQSLFPDSSWPIAARSAALRAWSHIPVWRRTLMMATAWVMSKSAPFEDAMITQALLSEGAADMFRITFLAIVFWPKSQKQHRHEDWQANTLHERLEVTSVKPLLIPTLMLS